MFDNLDSETYNIISEMTNGMLPEWRNKKGGENMLRGLEEIREEGREEGELLTTIRFARKLIVKNMSIPMIAAELETSEDTITRIREIVKEHPEYSAEQIYSEI